MDHIVSKLSKEAMGDYNAVLTLCDNDKVGMSIKFN